MGWPDLTGGASDSSAWVRYRKDASYKSAGSSNEFPSFRRDVLKIINTESTLFKQCRTFAGKTNRYNIEVEVTSWGSLCSWLTSLFCYAYSNRSNPEHVYLGSVSLFWCTLQTTNSHHRWPDFKERSLRTVVANAIEPVLRTSRHPSRSSSDTLLYCNSVDSMQIQAVCFGLQPNRLILLLFWHCFSHRRIYCIAISQGH
jgi:hypothetical protein